MLKVFGKILEFRADERGTSVGGIDVYPKPGVLVCDCGNFVEGIDGAG